MYGESRTQSRPVGPQGRAGIFLCGDEWSDLFERAEKDCALAFRNLFVFLASATVRKHKNGLFPPLAQYVENRRVVSVPAEEDERTIPIQIQEDLPRNLHVEIALPAHDRSADVAPEELESAVRIPYLFCEIFVRTSNPIFAVPCSSSKNRQPAFWRSVLILILARASLGIIWTFSLPHLLFLRPVCAT